MTLDTITTLNDGDLMDLATNCFYLANPQPHHIPMAKPQRKRYQDVLAIARGELEFRLHNHLAEVDGTALL